jgi:hypothetical protein
VRPVLALQDDYLGSLARVGVKALYLEHIADIFAAILLDYPLKLFLVESKDPPVDRRIAAVASGYAHQAGHLFAAEDDVRVRGEATAG